MTYLDLLAVDDEVAVVVLDSPVVHAVHRVVLEHCPTRIRHENKQQCVPRVGQTTAVYQC